MSGSNPIGDLIDGVGRAIGDVGHSIDSFVRDTIPGGWVTVGAGALLAAGITDPELLNSAESGTLTTEQLTTAGVDPVTVAKTVSTANPAVVQASSAALSSGVTPEMIALANTTADPIAALNAAAGWTASDPLYLASIGYTGMIVDPVTGAATDVATAARAEGSGWTATNGSVPGSQYVDANGTYFNGTGQPVAYTQPDGTILQAGQTAAPVTAPVEPAPAAPPGGVATETPISPYTPPGATELPGGFQNAWEQQTAANGGFTTRADWMHAQDFGIGNAADYQAALDAGTIPPANTVATTLPNGQIAYYDPATGTVYNVNGTVNTAATAGAPTAGPGTQVAGPYTPAQEAQYNQLIAEGKTPIEATDIVESGTSTTPFQVNVNGTAGFEGNPTAVTGSLSNGAQLATQAQIDAGTATFNPAANAWEVAGTPAELTPVVPGATGGVGAGGSTYGVGGVNYVAPVVANAADAVIASAGLTAEQVAVLGGTVAAAAAVNSLGASGAAQAANAAMTPAPAAPVSVTPVGTELAQPPVTTAPPVVETPVITPPAPAPAPVAPAPVAPAPVTTPPAPVVETPVVPTTTTPAPYTGPGIGEVPNPAEVPVTDLSTTAQPMGPSPYDWVAPAAIGAGVGAVAAGALGGSGGAATPAGYGPIATPRFGKLGDLANPGLNPGFVTARPFYQTTSPVQAQYYWGNHPYAYDQADLANYNTVPAAPIVPWGVQQAQTPLDVNALIRAVVNPQTQAAAAGTVPGYYAPYASTAYTGGKV